MLESDMPNGKLRVFMITSEWPTLERPHDVPFIVRQVNFLRKAGVELQVFPFRGGKSLSNYARAWREAQAELRSGQYHLVHAQWGQSGLLALPKRIPLVVTFRGDDLEGIIGPDGKPSAQGQILKSASKMVAQSADQVIVVSESLTRNLPGKNFHIIPSGLDLELFCPSDQLAARRRLGLDPHRKYVLFAGAAGNPRKRYSLATQVVQMLQRHLDAELLTASGVDHEQMADYMNAADVLLLVSIHEGSPNVVKEALACNLPVVSRPVGDVAERIGGIPGCVLLKNDQPETIAATLEEVLARGRRIQGRSTVLDLDENKLTQKVISVYRLALQGKK